MLCGPHVLVTSELNLQRFAFANKAQTDTIFGPGLVDCSNDRLIIVFAYLLFTTASQIHGNKVYRVRQGV